MRKPRRHDGHEYLTFFVASCSSWFGFVTFDTFVSFVLPG